MSGQDRQQSAPDASAIRARVRALLGEHAPRVNNITDEDSILHLGIDSLAMCEVAGGLECELGVPVESEILLAYPTIGALVRELSRRMCGERPPEATPRNHTPASAPHPTAQTEAVAIIGMACRFPQAASPEQLWILLSSEVDTVAQVPDTRWPAGDPQGGRWGALLHDVSSFDAGFFGMDASEARAMDPQQRLFLELAIETLTDAGMSPRHIAGSDTGVFVGVSNSDYARLVAQNSSLVDAHYGTGNLHAMVANRVSCFLDLHGPSMAIDTACSSSLVALDLACQALRSEQCGLALAGGVNLVLSPEGHITFAQAGSLAADGHCRAFDAHADGFSRGEGAGAVLLKPLSAAQRDGNRVYAVIRSSAVNHNGHMPTITTPSGKAQRQVIQQALKRADLKAADVSYVEAQATSLPLADVTELRALGEVLSDGRPAHDNCLVGSIKTNLGNLEAASGMAALIKVILCMTHAEIPPHLHLRSTPRGIDLERWRLTIPTRRVAWPRGTRSRIAGISSFALGGTNAHVLIEEPPVAHRLREEVPSPQPARSAELLWLAAHSPTALRELARRCAARAGHSRVIDMCFSMHPSDAGHRFRASIQASDPRELERRLRSLAAGEPTAGVHLGELRENAHSTLAFALPGEGEPPFGRGAMLHAIAPQFRRALAQCADAVEAELGPAMRAMLLGIGQPDGSLPLVHAAQFSLQYGVAMQLRTWGLVPDRLLGFGVGEYVIASLEGRLSLQDALTGVVMRARRLADNEKLKWLEVDASLDAVARLRTYLPALTLVDVTDDLCLVGLPATGVTRLSEALQAHDLPHRVLVGASDGEDAASQLRQTLGVLGHLEAGVIIEVASMGRLAHHLQRARMTSACMPCDPDRWHDLLDLFGRLHLLGFSVDGPAWFAGCEARRLPMPTYPFEREQHWLPQAPSLSHALNLPQDAGLPHTSSAQTAHPLIHRLQRQTPSETATGLNHSATARHRSPHSYTARDGERGASAEKSLIRVT